MRQAFAAFPLVIVWFSHKKTPGAAVFAPDKTGYNKTMAKPHQHESSVLEARRNKLAPPPLYTVLLLNDDFTPMDFVVHVLQKFFSKNQEQATQIMLKVHME